MIETPLSAPYFEDPHMREILTTNTPQGRWGQVAEIAGPAVFLCSDAAAHIHGATLVGRRRLGRREGLLSDAAPPTSTKEPPCLIPWASAR